jgi:hypothetical protein
MLVKIFSGTLRDTLGAAFSGVSAEAGSLPPNSE